MEGIRTELQKGGKTLYPKTVSDIVGREGKDESVEQSLQNLEKFAGGGNLRALFEAAGAVLNEDTGMWSLNGIDDLTWEDMADVVIETGPLNQSAATAFNGREVAKARTNLAPSYSEKSIQINKFRVPNMEVLNTGEPWIFPDSVNDFCRDSPKLRTVLGIINLGFMKNLDTRQIMFQSSTLLENVQIYKLLADIYLNSLQSLSVESVLCMIKNNIATKNITITLHPEAFARAMSDEAVQAALADKPLVSLAQAEL